MTGHRPTTSSSRRSARHVHHERRHPGRAVRTDPQEVEAVRVELPGAMAHVGDNLSAPRLTEGCADSSAAPQSRHDSERLRAADCGDDATDGELGVRRGHAGAEVS